MIMKSTRFRVTCALHSNYCQLRQRIEARGFPRAFFLFSLFLLLSVSGCSRALISTPQEYATSLAQEQNLAPFITRKGSFKIQGFKKISSPAALRPLHIFIEGDGRAWRNRYASQVDASPANPLGLRIALSHPETDKVYLGRPCQFIMSDICRSRYPQTAGRFDRKVLDTYMKILNDQRKEAPQRPFILHGYSGGGTLALLLGLSRSDVVGVYTYAAPLDVEAWTSHHEVSPLQRAVNPTAFVKQSGTVQPAQLHFCGTRDDKVPCALTHAAVRSAFPSAKIIEKPYSHTSGWETLWQQEKR